MAIEPELQGSDEGVETVDGPDTSFDTVLDAVRRQLRDAVPSAEPK